MPEHEVFYVLRDGGVVTVSHEVTDGAEVLAEYGDPGEAIDRAQEEARRRELEYVDPPENLVGVG